MASTLFPDISVFQPNANIPQIREWTGAIAARILYGNTPDKMMPGRIAAIRAEKFDAVIYYIFMRSAVSVGDQANACYALLPTLLPGEAVCVDWEKDTDGTTPNNVMRNALLALLDTHYDQPTVLYGSASSLALLELPANTRPIWAAGYSSVEPAVRHDIWQSTDGTIGSNRAVWPGAGYCDTSIYHGTSQQLAQLISPSRIKVAPMYNPAIVVEPVVADLGCPSGGAWTLAASGAVDAWGGAPYLGGANGKPYFAGRSAAKLELPLPTDAAGSRYVVVDTAGERYAF